MSEQENTEVVTEETVTDTENQETVAKTYSEEEFNNHMAGLKKSLTKRFEKQFQELGDIDELKQLKQKAERAKEAEAIRKGEFEKILSEKAANWNNEIQKRDTVIKEYKINTPLLNEAAKLKSVNPEQVKQLLSNQVRLNDDGDVEVVDSAGSVKYNDDGKPWSVEQLVNGFLKENPHFVSATPATTNTRSSVSGPQSTKDFDLSKLDMNNPEHRQLYKQARGKGLV